MLKAPKERFSNFVRINMKMDNNAITKYAIQAAFPLTKDNSFKSTMPELQMHI
jgi:hypothetical protein